MLTLEDRVSRQLDHLQLSKRIACEGSSQGLLKVQNATTAASPAGPVSTAELYRREIAKQENSRLSKCTPSVHESRRAYKHPTAALSLQASRLDCPSSLFSAQHMNKSIYSCAACCVSTQSLLVSGMSAGCRVHQRCAVALVHFEVGATPLSRRPAARLLRCQVGTQRGKQRLSKTPF